MLRFVAEQTRDCSPARSTSRRKHRARSSTSQTQWQWRGLVSNLTLLSDSCKIRVVQIKRRATVPTNNSAGAGEHERMHLPPGTEQIVHFWHGALELHGADTMFAHNARWLQLPSPSLSRAPVYLCAQNGDARSGAHWACAVTSARSYVGATEHAQRPQTSAHTHTHAGCAASLLACLHHNKQGMCTSSEHGAEEEGEGTEQGSQRRGGAPDWQPSVLTTRTAVTATSDHQ